MKFTNNPKFGSSTCFTGKFDREAFRGYAAAGIDCVELSTNYNNYFNTWEFVDRPEDYARIAADEGVEIWSVHLPFSRKLDISNEDKELRAVTLYTDRAMIRASARAGAKVIVLHPSSEPIDDERRPEDHRDQQRGPAGAHPADPRRTPCPPTLARSRRALQGGHVPSHNEVSPCSNRCWTRSGGRWG